MSMSNENTYAHIKGTFTHILCVTFSTTDTLHSENVQFKKKCQTKTLQWFLHFLCHINTKKEIMQFFFYLHETCFFCWPNTIFLRFTSFHFIWVVQRAIEYSVSEAIIRRLFKGKYSWKKNYWNYSILQQINCLVETNNL